MKIKHESFRTGDYTGRKVLCPNACYLGYSKMHASPGDVVAWRYDGESDRTHFGRVMGRVDCPADGPGCPAVKGWLCVLKMNDTCTHCYPVWVDPKHVTEVRNAPKALPTWFFADKLPAIADVLRMSAYGSLSEEYIGKVRA